MIYLKAIVFGMVALILFVVTFFIVETVWASHKVNGPVSIDVIHFATWPPVWLGAIASFVICFYWTISRRVRRRIVG